MEIVPCAVPIGVETCTPSRLLLEEWDRESWGEAPINTAKRRRGAKINAKGTIESKKTTPI